MGGSDNEIEIWGGERRPAGWFERLLWFSAGANIGLLERCPNSDRVKYQGLGGVVLATAVLAFASGYYAIYTIFAPKTELVLDKSTHWPTVWMSLGVALVWSLIIFNLDRFIVSSTGKGDGTDAITGGEALRALPRFVMAVLIGLCISAPLEIRVLKPEIDSQLRLEQEQYAKKLDAGAEVSTEQAHAELRRKIDEAQRRLDESDERFEKRRIEIEEQHRLLELEAEGLTGSGQAGRGPAWQDKKDTLDKLEKELETDRAAAVQRSQSARKDIARWNQESDAKQQGLATIKQGNKKQALAPDGIMKRIQISHAIGGMIPWAIMLLLLAIECGPIIFKLMLVKGTYDYLEENDKHLRQARMGVMVDGNIRMDKDGKEVRADRFLRAERMIAEERLRLETEQLLSEQVHAEFRAKTSAEIQADPAPFLAPPRGSEKRA